METLIELVRAGFHGLALAILLLGFFLLRKVVDANTGDNGHGRDDSSLLGHIRTFLIISLVFLVVGATLEVWRLSLVHEARVHVTVSPRDMPEEAESPELVAGEEVHSITGTPRRVTVKDAQSLVFRVDGLCHKIRQHEKLLSELTADMGEQSDEMGI